MSRAQARLDLPHHSLYRFSTVEETIVFIDEHQASIPVGKDGPDISEI